MTKKLLVVLLLLSFQLSADCRKVLVLGCNPVIYNELYKNLIASYKKDPRWINKINEVSNERNRAIETLRKLCRQQRSIYENPTQFR